MSILRYARNTNNRITYLHTYVHTHTVWIGLTAISGISANEFRTVKNDIKNALITPITLICIHTHAI